MIFSVLTTSLYRVACALRICSMFVLPNFKPLISGKVSVGKSFKVEQQVKVTGNGIVSIGSNCLLGCALGGYNRFGLIELQARSSNARIYIRNNIATNNNLFVCAANRIEIDDDTLIGNYVQIFDFEAHGVQPSRRRKNVSVGEVYIGKNVWIGSNVIILKDTKISEGSVIAAGAVVKGAFPPAVLIGGIPARVIKMIKDE
jgi:acetyltransferase-like isoleucine patch superfamily enzyme